MKLEVVFTQRRRSGESFTPGNRDFHRNYQQTDLPSKSITTKKMQISGHSMGQELELPRQKILIEITQNEARYDDCRKSSSQRRFT